MTLQTMAMIAGALLTIYIVAIVVVIIKPSKAPDPHDGMARGCLGFVVLGLLLLGGGLTIGITWDWPWLIHIPFYITVYPTVLLVANLLYQGLRKLRK